MRIDSASINLAAQYSRVETTEVSESFSLSIGRPPQPAASDAVSLSDEGLAASDQASAIEHALEEAENDPRLSLLRELIEHLTGQKIKRLALDEHESKDKPDETHEHKPAQGVAPAPSEGFSLAYDYHSRTVDTQQLSFNAQGVIRTKDGQEISFNLDYQLASVRVEQVDVSIRAGDAAKVKDPLVFNFNGNAAALSDVKFAFDLDADGEKDHVSLLQPGSAFLALDKNHDGQINNGKELFGPSTGNGFSELATYDEDNNQFIDEADTIYTQLRLFTPSAESNGSQVSLKNAGIGAIYLGNVVTPFEFGGGLLRSSGVYLKEDGGVGTVQQIDLKV